MEPAFLSLRIGFRLLGGRTPLKSAGERLSVLVTGDTVANMDFRTESVLSMADQVRKGALSARDLVGHAFERIEADNPRLTLSWLWIKSRAMVAAASIDEHVASGGDPGPLAGIPIGVKDLEDSSGFVTTQGSALFADGQPALADSPLVARLVAAGCVVVGKTNTPELGWKADTDNAVFGPTLNPWNLEYSPGGSSGGAQRRLPPAWFRWPQDPMAEVRSGFPRVLRSVGDQAVIRPGTNGRR